MSTRNKIKLQYISKNKYFLRFYEDSLDLNSFLSIVKESIIMKFIGFILSGYYKYLILCTSYFGESDEDKIKLHYTNKDKSHFINCSVS